MHSLLLIIDTSVAVDSTQILSCLPNSPLLPKPVDSSLPSTSKSLVRRKGESAILQYNWVLAMPRSRMHNPKSVLKFPSSRHNHSLTSLIMNLPNPNTNLLSSISSLNLVIKVPQYLHHPSVQKIDLATLGKVYNVSA